MNTDANTAALHAWMTSCDEAERNYERLEGIWPLEEFEAPAAEMLEREALDTLIRLADSDTKAQAMLRLIWQAVDMREALPVGYGDTGSIRDEAVLHDAAREQFQAVQERLQAAKIRGEV